MKRDKELRWGSESNRANEERRKKPEAEGEEESAEETRLGRLDFLEARCRGGAMGGGCGCDCSA